MKFFSWKFANSQNHSTRKVRLQITTSRPFFLSLSSTRAFDNWSKNNKFRTVVLSPLELKPSMKFFKQAYDKFSNLFCHLCYDINISNSFQLLVELNKSLLYRKQIIGRNDEKMKTKICNNKNCWKLQTEIVLHDWHQRSYKFVVVYCHYQKYVENSFGMFGRREKLLFTSEASSRKNICIPFWSRK